jgi:hypothetical protein
VICEVADCNNKANRKQYCEPHYDQVRKGRAVNGIKICMSCDVLFTDVKSSRNVRKYCFDCNPVGDKTAANLLCDYGLSRPMFDAMYFEQDGSCAMAGCSREASVVDHWHGCQENHGRARGCLKCVRGLLCRGCNAGLGRIEDMLFVGACKEYLSYYGNGGGGMWS